jgi:hypothetical protein
VRGNTGPAGPGPSRPSPSARPTRFATRLPLPFGQSPNKGGVGRPQEQSSEDGRGVGSKRATLTTSTAC